MPTIPDSYKILGLGPNATDEDIKKAYKTLAKKWHPDKNPGLKEEAERRFKEISVAYQILANRNSRSFTGSYSTSDYSSRASSYHSADFKDFKDFEFKSADELFREFFGNATIDEALESIINDPMFTSRGLPTVSSRRFNTGGSPVRPEKPPGGYADWHNFRITTHTKYTIGILLFFATLYCVWWTLHSDDAFEKSLPLTRQS